MKVLQSINKILSDEKIFYIFFAAFLLNLPLSEALKETALSISFFIILYRLTNNGFDAAKKIVFIGIPLFLFTGISFLSAIHSINRDQALHGFWGDFEALMGWFVFSGAFLLLPNKIKTLRIILISLVVGIFVSGAIGTYEMIGNQSYPHLRLMNIGGKNYSAQFLSMTFLFILGLHGIKNEIRIPQWFLFFSLTMLAILLVLCHSRTFLVALPVGSLLMLVFSKKWKSAFNLSMILVGCAVVFLFSPHLRWEMRTVFHPTQDGSFMDRRQAWMGVIRILKDHPFLGIGPDTFRMANIHKIYHLPGYASHAHSLYFNLLGEYGFLGLISFFLILIYWIYRVFFVRHRMEGQNILSGMTIGFMANYLIAGIAHPMWGGSGSLMFVLVMAYILILDHT